MPESEPPEIGRFPDLRSMGEADQNKEVHGWAGLAFYFAQIFEQGLIHVLYAVRVVHGSHISYPSDT